MSQEIQNKARELLESKAVECVIGYERGTDGNVARPAFIYEPSDVGRLIFDDRCTHNLARYLLNKKAKKTAVVVKPCDARAINLLLNEKQIQRDKVYIIGVVCQGIQDVCWEQPSQQQAAPCKICAQHVPPVYDFLVGDPGAAQTSPLAFPDVEALEAKPVAERAAFWQGHLDRCIRCYACRSACTACYCPECFVERLDPLWVGIRIAPSENQMWHAIRAFHLAGRCIDCNECERVCPMDIPLSLLNRKLEKEVLDKFGFQPGLDAAALAPFAAFKKDEELGVG